MYKKLTSVVLAALLCLTLICPTAVYAAETDTCEVTNECANNKDEMQKKNEELFKKWNALSDKQKADVYKAVKATLDAQAKFFDKLVKYELMTKEEAKAIKEDMYAKFDEMKKNDALFGTKIDGNQPPKEQKNATPSTTPSTTPSATPTPAK